MLPFIRSFMTYDLQYHEGDVLIHSFNYDISQWAKSPKKQSVGVCLSAELTQTISFRLFFGNFAHWD